MKRILSLILLAALPGVANARNCTTGQPCGNSCISWSNVCHIGTTGSAPAMSNQTIGATSFSPATMVVGGTSAMSATATSGLGIVFSSMTPGICTVSGNTITAVAAGACTIAADQAGNISYSAAARTTQDIAVGTPAQTQAPAAISAARVFAYAEANYPSIFTGTAAAGQYQQYDYRYYPAAGNYLAVDTAGIIFLLGPYTGGVITPVGPVELFRGYITTWESTQTIR